MPTTSISQDPFSNKVFLQDQTNLQNVPIFFDTVNRHCNLTGFESFSVIDPLTPTITFIQTSTGKQVSIYYNGTDFVIGSTVVVGQSTQTTNVKIQAANPAIEFIDTVSGTTGKITYNGTQMVFDKVINATNVQSGIYDVNQYLGYIVGIQAQLASTRIAQVSSGLQTQLNDQYSDITTLQNKMASTKTVQVASGLQTQLNDIVTVNDFQSNQLDGTVMSGLLLYIQTLFSQTGSTKLAQVASGLQTQINDAITSINTLISQMASTKLVQIASGLQTQINDISGTIPDISTLQAQMASTKLAQVSSGLQTQINDEDSAIVFLQQQMATSQPSGLNTKIGTLESQMASSVGSLVASGLQTQLTNHDNKFAGSVTSNLLTYIQALEAQMASTKASPVTSGLQTQITGIYTQQANYDGYAQTISPMIQVNYPTSANITNGDTSMRYFLCYQDAYTPLNIDLTAGVYLVNYNINYSVTSTSGNYLRMQFYNYTASTDYDQGESWSGVTSGNNNYVGQFKGSAIVRVTSTMRLQLFVRLGTTNNAPTGLQWGYWDVNWLQIAQ